MALGRIVAVYPYTDAAGTLLYETVRYEPKDFRQRRPEGKNWVWNLGEGARVLYRLPALSAAPAGSRVFLVEGEKDADAVLALGLLATTVAGGAAAAWRPEYSAALAGQRVVVVPDNDRAGRECGARRLASLREAGVAVALLELPGLPEKGDISDWLAAGGAGPVLAALAEAALAVVPRPAPPGPLEARERLGRQVECQNQPPVSIAERVLEELVWEHDPCRRLEPELYRHAGRLVSLQQRPGALPAVRELSVMELKGWIDATMVFTTTNEKGRRAYQDCPYAVANLLMARRPWQDFGILEGIVTAPTYSREGRLHALPGYSPETRLYYDPWDAIPDPPAQPSPDELLAARTLLVEELLGDFPFTDAAGLAHAIALLLLPFVRAMIRGPTPLHLIDAPLAGIGKTLLAEVLTLPFCPRGVPVTTAPGEKEEWRKKLTAALSTGRSHLFLDNVPHRLNSAELASALTATYWEDRMLGQSTMVEYPVRCVWLATANNVRASAEIARRAVWIRLDPRAEAPWQRSGFRHDPLDAWVKEQRPALVTAALTLVQAWLAEGQPRARVRMGSFQDWAEVVGGILKLAFIPGFLANAEGLMERLDEQRAELRQLVGLWAASYGEQEVGVAEVYSLLGAEDLLAERLGDGTDRSRRTKLGKLLAAHEDQVIGAWQLVRVGKRHQGAKYSLLPAAGNVGGNVDA